jgi:3-oxoacyl-[acyl-carrier-protein] synthase II
LKRNIVITGIGAITPIGQNVETFWENCCRGCSGIRQIDRFDVSQYRSQIAGLIEDYDPFYFLNRKDALHLDRFTTLSVAAADQAMAQSCLKGNGSWRDNTAVVLGTGLGGINSVSEQMEVLRNSTPRAVNPFLMPMMLNNSASAFLAIRFGLKGPNFASSSACASGSSAVVAACHLIRSGAADIALTGASEAPVTPIIVAAFDSLKSLARGWNDEPQQASRPFDVKRRGFVISEGAAVLVIEELQHALDRGAEILAHITGMGETCDAFHMTRPANRGTGIAEAMRKALAEAGRKGSEIGFVNAHATSTTVGDQNEATAIRSVLGENIPVSALKSQLGHTLGAAGALSLVGSVMALREKIIPPTINVSKVDPKCGLGNIVQNAQKTEFSSVMNNAMGFGGHNVSILVESPNNQNSILNNN